MTENKVFIGKRIIDVPGDKLCLVFLHDEKEKLLEKDYGEIKEIDEDIALWTVFKTLKEFRNENKEK